MNLEKIDWLKPDAWDDSPDMYERFRLLRNNDPVHWSETSRIWIITTHKDVDYISRNQNIFTSAKGVRVGNPVPFGLIDDDEPHHTKVRQLINKGFTRSRVEMLGEEIRMFTIELMNQIIAKGKSDIVSDLSAPLPIFMIARLIGMPLEDLGKLREWSDALIMADGNYDNPEIMYKVAEAFLAFGRYMRDVAEDRIVNPKNDIISTLLGAKSGGLLSAHESNISNSSNEMQETNEYKALSIDELNMLLVLLTVAGNETTRNAISGGIAQFIENPEQLTLLKSKPELIRNAIEEIVRHVTPVRTFTRTVIRKTELSGKHLYPGQKVLLVYTSANRDEKVFINPDKFDINREPNPHLGFGIGSHVCLGANLARIEIKVVLEELIKRFSNMTYAGAGPEMHRNPLVRSFVNMPVNISN